MAIEFKTVRVEFDQTQGMLQTEPFSTNFDKDVVKAKGVLNGFSVKFSGGDHPLHHLQINILDGDNIKIQGGNVSGKVQLGLRDHSGVYDDRYGGWVDVALIVETK
jgi:hypothetical protein